MHQVLPLYKILKVKMIPLVVSTVVENQLPQKKKKIKRHILENLMHHG